MGFREEITPLLGRFPERVPLEMEVLSVEQEETYQRLLVTYNAEEGERVKAYLLLPDSRREKTPAIVACHQHNVMFHLGKSEAAGLAGDPDMAYGRDLAMRGYIVVCPDLLAFEDRRYGKYFEAQYNRDCTFEKITAQYLLAQGRTLCGKYMFDLSRAVDLLCSLPDVDQERIGTIGHSTGGQSATWLTWYDDRIKAGVSSCGFARVRDLLAHKKGHNLAMVVPGMLEAGDYDDVLLDIAPRNFLFTCGNYDPTFLMDSCLTIRERVEEKYRRLGKEENFRAIFFEGWHWMRKDVKEKVYAWLDEKLKGGDGHDSE